jgi:hypothetical protein
MVMYLMKNLSISFCIRMIAVVVITNFGVLISSQAQSPQKDCDIRMNAIVSSEGNLRNDGKGTYFTGNDYIAVWLNPSRYPDQSFHICMNWPFGGFPECDSATAPALTGMRENRTLLHQMTDPVSQEGGQRLGVFTGPGGGNDIAMSKPLTSTVTSFIDMEIGASLSPQSTEVRFCNSDCSKYYSLIFGDKSVFGYQNINGTGTTRPIVTRTSETTWTINFPPQSVGRLWDRAIRKHHKAPTSELYYYRGNLEIQKQ